jgi:rubrerythrin
MAGGIHAWEGLVADGPPEAGLSRFEAARDAGEMAAVAWHMEENTRKFYLALSGLVSDPAASDLLEDLAMVEEKHKSTLMELYRNVTGLQGEPESPGEGPPVLEGGQDMEQTLRWAEGRDHEEILHVTIALETNAYDRYLKMADRVEDPESKRIFRTISGEERDHLARMTQMMDKILQADYEYRE